MDKLREDSILLKTLEDEEEYPDIIKENVDILLPVYDNRFVKDDIIKYINAASYLGCEDKVIELLIILHFTDKLSINLLNEDLISYYNRMQFSETKIRTFIKYNLIDTLININNYYLNDSICDRANFLFACKHGSLKMVQWIYNFNVDNLEEDNLLHITIFFLACEEGFLDIAKWIYSIDKIGIEHSDVMIPFRKSCFNGHLNIVQWLLSLNITKIDIHWNDNYIFKSVCRNGHLEIAKLLYSDDFSISNIREGFHDACKNGHLNIAQWLYHIKKGIIFNKSITNICECYNIEIVKWLWSVDQILDNQIDIYETFISACRYEKLHIAKCIHSFNKIDIYQNNNQAFISACRNGCLEIVIWMYYLSISEGCTIDIHMDDDKLFKISSLSVKEWLESIV